MVELTVLDARCYVCGHLISGPTTIYTDKGQAHPSCVNCSPYAEARIAEQAVTEAMVEAAVQAVRQYTRDTLFIDEHRELVRSALKAAMEAGR